ncbi:MAG: iron ABC transporter permease [Bacteroidota bacterium]|nr:iron ABC transporter permease [Bacteroidota bacterium]
MSGTEKRSNKGPLFTLISVLALILATPLFVVITSPFHSSAPEWQHVSSTIPSHLFETLQLSAGVLLIALFIAVPSAWLVANFQFPGRWLFNWALVMPLAMPTYISAFAYGDLFGSTGRLSISLHNAWGFRLDIMNLTGLSFVLAFVLFPYIYLPARAALSKGMASQLEAARTLGAKGIRRFGLIALPLSRPAIAGGALLLLMETLNDYGAVKYFGVRTLTTGIFRSWGGLYDTGSALRLSVVLLGLIAVLLALEQWQRKGVLQTTDQVPIARLELKGFNAILAISWCVLILVLSLLLPLGKIVLDVIDQWHELPWSGTLSAFGNTLYIAALAAVSTLIIAILFAYRQRHRKDPDLALRIAGLGYAIPGAVIAIGVMAMAGWIDQRTAEGYAMIGTIGLLTYAFNVRFLAVGTQPLYGNLRQQSVDLDEAARTLGASTWRTFIRINLPLLRQALLAASLLVAIDVIKELPLTLILRPFNVHTLSTQAYALASIEQLGDASWPALLIVLCGLLPVLLLENMLARTVR